MTSEAPSQETSRLAWWNGRLVAEAEIAISPADAGLLSGDGLFETLRADAGRLRDVEAHLDRLELGLKRIDLPIPEDRAALAAALANVAQAVPGPVARVRLTVSRGAGGLPTRLITAKAYEPPPREAHERGVSAVLLHDLRVDSRGPLVNLKSLSYQANALALRRAEAAGDFEALLLNERGLLAEGSRSNVIAVLSGRAWTPPLTDGCLAGTVRRRLIERGLLAERSLSIQDLHKAQEILLTNSLVGALPIGSLDGHPVAVGCTARRLVEALRDL
jgi:branched-chain amino acid aminotransferase